MECKAGGGQPSYVEVHGGSEMCPEQTARHHAEPLAQNRA